MTVRKNWRERLAVGVSGWALGIIMGLSMCKWLFH
jgi:hypothetical protein